jgi:hypothetical protein
VAPAAANGSGWANTRGIDVDLSKFGRDDWLVAGGGCLLIVDLLFFPWLQGTVAYLGVSVSYTAKATSAPGSLWGLLALIFTIAVVADFALAQLRPQTQLLVTKLGRPMTRCAGAALVVFFLMMKLFAGTSFLGFGCYLGFVLAIAVVVGSYRYAQTAEL